LPWDLPSVRMPNKNDFDTPLKPFYRTLVKENPAGFLPHSLEGGRCHWTPQIAHFHKTVKIDNRPQGSNSCAKVPTLRRVWGSFHSIAVACLWKTVDVPPGCDALLGQQAIGCGAGLHAPRGPDRRAGTRGGQAPALPRSARPWPAPAFSHDPRSHPVARPAARPSLRRGHHGAAPSRSRFGPARRPGGAYWLPTPRVRMRTAYRPLPAVMKSVRRSAPPKQTLAVQGASTAICSTFRPSLSKTVTPLPVR